MHDSALLSGALFGKVYGKPGMKVLDVGGQDVNGCLRTPLTVLSKLEYLSVDIEAGSNVDIVVKPGDPLPFPDGTFDLIVSTSCFEHDPCFWITFREMARVVKVGGYIYVNAPSNGPYHGYPGDNWRFYSDAGQALAYWSSKTVDGKSFPVSVEETFHILPKTGYWIDFVTVWKRTTEPQTDIVLSDKIRNNNGGLKYALNSVGWDTQIIIYQK